MDAKTVTLRMLPDGGYGESVYGGYVNIRGCVSYKFRFLEDARAMLKAVGKLLALHGLTEKTIAIYPSGEAVSGEAAAYFWKPDAPDKRVWCQISESVVGADRKDSLVWLARVETMGMESERRGARRSAKATWRTRRFGVNQWLSANLDSQELADRLLHIFDQATYPVSTQCHTQTVRVLMPDSMVTEETT